MEGADRKLRFSEDAAGEGGGKGPRRQVTRPAECTARAIPGHSMCSPVASGLISETHQLPALGLHFFANVDHIE